MPRGVWIALLASAAFVVIVVTRLPARWVVGHLVHHACSGVDGTVWDGSCSGLTLQHAALGDLTWDLKPARLLGGVLEAHVALTHGAADGHADVAIGLHAVTLRNLIADLPLDPALIPQLPQQLRGTAHLDLALVRLQNNAITELEGRIEAHDLEQRTGQVLSLGSYALTFPGGNGPQTATLQDLGGPLAVSGTLRLTPEGYEIEGTVAARPGAAPELANSLQYLGSPDSLGRRPFSMAGTF